MRPLRTIAAAALVFVLAGPAIGMLITLRRGGYDLRLVPLVYLLGAVPALAAGIIYGLVRVRAGGASWPWHRRALWGACAGLCGCLVLSLAGAASVWLTSSEPVMDTGLLRLTLVAGVPAGALCAMILVEGRHA